MLDHSRRHCQCLELFPSGSSRSYLFWKRSQLQSASITDQPLTTHHISWKRYQHSGIGRSVATGVSLGKNGGMQYYRPTWFEQQTLEDTGWMRRSATRWLCRQVRRSVELRPFYMAARVLFTPSDDEARDEVLRAFGEWRDQEFQGRVLSGLQEACQTGELERHRPVPDLPRSVTRFLLADGRIAEYLDQAEPAFPRPSGLGHSDVALWLVDSAVHSADVQARSDLAGLLSETEHPELLRQLGKLFWEALQNEQGGHPSKVRLWIDGQPTDLTRIILANPNFPLPMTEEERTASGIYGHAPKPIVAVLKDQLDKFAEYLVPQFSHAVVRDLLDAIEFAAPEDFIERCRQALRSLPPGAAREQVVQSAILNHAEAIAAAVDAGYAPAEERDLLVFLFITQQWERYDEADPDGSKLTAYCAKHAHAYVGTYRHQIEHAAQVSGRPNPCPVIPPVDPSTETQRPYGPIGSWPTSPGNVTGSW